MDGPCKVDGCERKAQCQGMCSMHFKRWKKYGSPDIKKSNKGKKYSPEHCAKISAALSGGVAHGLVCTIEGCGRKHHCRGWCYRHYTSDWKYGSPTYIESAEHEAKVSKIRAKGMQGKVGHWRGKKRGNWTPEHCAKIGAAHKGKVLTLEHRANLSKARTGISIPGVSAAIKLALAKRSPKMEKARRSKLSAIGSANPPKYSRGNKTEYKGITFRSSWEARMAIALDRHGIQWQYEPHVVDLGCCSYRPDFFLTKEGHYIEVKGYFDARSVKKINLFREQRPETPLIVVNESALKMFESSVRNFI